MKKKYVYNNYGYPKHNDKIFDILDTIESRNNNV